MNNEAPTKVDGKMAGDSKSTSTAKKVDGSKTMDTKTAPKTDAKNLKPITINGIQVKPGDPQSLKQYSDGTTKAVASGQLTIKMADGSTRSADPDSANGKWLKSYGSAIAKSIPHDDAVKNANRVHGEYGNADQQMAKAKQNVFARREAINQRMASTPPATKSEVGSKTMDSGSQQPPASSIN
jgi:hypothetical protein